MLTAESWSALKRYTRCQVRHAEIGRGLGGQGFIPASHLAASAPGPGRKRSGILRMRKQRLVMAYLLVSVVVSVGFSFGFAPVRGRARGNFISSTPTIPLRHAALWCAVQLNTRMDFKSPASAIPPPGPRKRPTYTKENLAARLQDSRAVAARARNAGRLEPLQFSGYQTSVRTSMPVLARRSRKATRLVGGVARK